MIQEKTIYMGLNKCDLRNYVVFNLLQAPDRYLKAIYALLTQRDLT